MHEDVMDKTTPNTRTGWSNEKRRKTEVRGERSLKK